MKILIQILIAVSKGDYWHQVLVTISVASPAPRHILQSVLSPWLQCVKCMHWGHGMHWHMTHKIGRKYVHSWNYFLWNGAEAKWWCCCVYSTLIWLVKECYQHRMNITRFWYNKVLANNINNVRNYQHCWCSYQLTYGEVIHESKNQIQACTR